MNPFLSRFEGKLSRVTKKGPIELEHLSLGPQPIDWSKHWTMRQRKLSEAMQMTPLSKDPSEYSAIVESITSISLKNRKNQQLSEKLSSRVLTLNSLIHDKMATEEMKRRKRLKPIIRLEPESAGFSDQTGRQRSSDKTDKENQVGCFSIDEGFLERLNKISQPKLPLKKLKRIGKAASSYAYHF